MLDCQEIAPNTDQPQAAVIWMHGLGADANDFLPIVPHLDCPQVRFVFPNAPVRRVTINAGYAMRAWYDIRTFDRVPDREDGDHIREAAAEITALIDRELARGIPPERIFLAGFSQGAAMAHFVGLRETRTLAGIVVLSGYLVLEDTLADERHSSNAATPMFFGHGAFDDVVLPDLGRAAYEAVQEGRSAEWHTYPMAHSVHPEQIAHLRDWLHARLAALEPNP